MRQKWSAALYRQQNSYTLCIFIVSLISPYQSQIIPNVEMDEDIVEAKLTISEK